MNHVFGDVFVDVINGEEVREGGELKGEVFTLAEPRMEDQLCHLDSLFWVGGEEPSEKILATWAGEGVSYCSAREMLGNDLLLERCSGVTYC